MTDIKGKIALVTGTNGAVGRALVPALLDRGAVKVYACAMDSTSACYLEGPGSERVVAVGLDITRAAGVAAAARRCRDVDFLINNAGINGAQATTGPLRRDALREQMEVDYFGALGLCLAFAPILASRGGGTIVNVCSAASKARLPLNGIYRAWLDARNVRVCRAFPEHPESAASIALQAAMPAQVAEAILVGLEKDAVEIAVSVDRGAQGEEAAA